MKQGATQRFTFGISRLASSNFMDSQLNQRNANAGQRRWDSVPRLNVAAIQFQRQADVIAQISKEQLREVLPGLFQDKVILAFAGSWTLA